MVKSWFFSGGKGLGSTWLRQEKIFGIVSQYHRVREREWFGMNLMQSCRGNSIPEGGV